MKKSLLLFLVTAMITICSGNRMYAISVKNGARFSNIISSEPTLTDESEKWTMSRVYFLGEEFKGFKACAILSGDSLRWHIYEDGKWEDVAEMSEILNEVKGISSQGMSDNAKFFSFEGSCAKIDRIGVFPKDNPKFSLMAVWEKTGTDAAIADDDIIILMERAQQGDVEACLKMAQRYHDGYGVNKDILMVRYMLFLAEKRNGREVADSFYAALPENDEARLYYEAIENPNHDKRIKTLERIYNDGLIPAKLIKAVESFNNDDAANGWQLLKEAAEDGSQFALALLISKAYGHGDAKQAKVYLGKFMDKYPFLLKMFSDANTSKKAQ